MFNFCLVGTVMAMFTAALQCCLMDSSLAGASICVSILAGCWFGTEGKSLHFNFHISLSLTMIYHNLMSITVHVFVRLSHKTCFCCYCSKWRMMIAALVFLILVICTNYSMICFICHGLYVYGPWLRKFHNVDLWLLRVLVSIWQMYSKFMCCFIQVNDNMQCSFLILN